MEMYIIYICMIQASKANTCWLQLPHKYKTTQAWDRHRDNQQFPKIPNYTHNKRHARRSTYGWEEAGENLLAAVPVA